jgi:hypothetical protein
MREAKGDKEVEGCTFEPTLYGTKPGDPTRDLDSFIKDQQTFLEKKQQKIDDKRMQDGDKDVEGVTLEPKLDDLSMAIVGLMEERRLEPTHERLYKKGATKLRDITLME